MRSLSLSAFYLACTLLCFGQKPPVDTSQFEKWPLVNKWPFVGSPDISNDGNYVTYAIERQPFGSRTLIVENTRTRLKKQFVGGKDGFFSGDSRQFIFSRDDSMFLITLNTGHLDTIVNVYSSKRPDPANGKWLAYQLNKPEKQVVLHNFFTGKDYKFESVAGYLCDDAGNGVILERNNATPGNKTANILQWVSLSTLAIHTIWPVDGFSGHYSAISNYNFLSDGAQLTFMVRETKSGVTSNSIWHYDTSMNKANLLVNEQTEGIDAGTSVDNEGVKFSKNGHWVLFKLRSPDDTIKPRPDAVKVDVWNYKDVLLQSEQLLGEPGAKTFAAAIDAKGGQVIRLTTGDEEIIADDGGDYAIVTDNKHRTAPWWDDCPNSYYLVFLKDGARKLITKGSSVALGMAGHIPYLAFSPEGKFIVYFDGKKNAYFSYEILNGVTRNISEAAPAHFAIDDPDQRPGESYPVGIGGWFVHDSALMVYDNYDIWLIDPLGRSVPTNITNGFGRSHHIKFRLVYEREAMKGLAEKEPILLGAFNIDNKYNGFYRKMPARKGDPKLLVLGPYIFDHDLSISFPYDEDGDLGMAPLKARNADIWMVKRLTASEAPNFYLTGDLVNYTALTDLEPQRRYNWLTSELVTWKQLDGTTSQGILYKPEDFNPQKKYPVIFNYYERMSSRLYDFLKPGFTESRINIPWFVSNGYLVFTPDIHFSIAKTSGKVNGESTCNAIISAARYLSTMPWVDSKKMGIQGHSFGGQETNYLVTHTNLFAAAAEAAGTSDMVSTYLSIAWPLGSNGGDRQHITEVTQGRMSATLWERPDLYLKASPILRANQVTTPLLIIHNKADDAVPWGQGVEMFMALRRLHKKVWMLQYDESDHGIFGKDEVDYTIRLTQFFDHYLKDAPAPKWMTEGIPARLKGVETGYELDPGGSCGKDCPVCNKRPVENGRAK